MQGIDSDLIRGHIDTIILKVLFEGDRYGYEICKEVEEKSNGTYELKQPTLYSCLKRLESQGLISSYWEESDIGGKRHYYKLTEEGRKTFQENYDEWTRSREIIDNLISNPFVKASSYALVNKEEMAELEKEAESKVDEETLQKAKDEAYEKGLEEGKRQAEMLSQKQTEEDENKKKQEEIVASILNVSSVDEGSEIPWQQDNSPAPNEDIDAFEWHDQSNGIVASSANGEEVEVYPSSEQEDQDEVLPFEAEDDHSQVSFFEESEPEEEPAKKIEYSREIPIEYEQAKLLNEPTDSTREPVKFEFDANDYTLSSSESYFDSADFNEPKPDYIAPEMKIDGLESKPEEKQEDNLVPPSPIYHDFGANNIIKTEEDEVWVDDSELDADSIYLNPDQAKGEDKQEEITLFEDDVNKEAETEEVEDYSKKEPVESNYMDFYKSTENYDQLDPSYTDEQYKEKLSSLMTYSNEAKEDPKEEKPALAKSYAELKVKFEEEGLVVKEHKKFLKESSQTRSYIESNKINLVTSWTAFGIITFLLTLTYFIASHYRSTLDVPAYAYFLVGMAVLMIVPLVYTVLFIINPYKKKPARYAFRIYMLFAMLLTIQLIIITYCINLQLGFYSFSQPTYNHFLWIVPLIISFYPILDAILHNVYFKSKNFHV